jgi:hypothetical protein
MGTGQKQTPRLADSRPESAHAPAEADVILKHCRCMDCRNFSQVGQDYFCSEYIGGTSVVWATGKRECDPPQDAWHYCSHYDGPQSSKDVWLWPRRSRHVGPGSTISLRAGPRIRPRARAQRGRDVSNGARWARTFRYSAGFRCGRPRREQSGTSFLFVHGVNTAVTAAQTRS